MYVSDKAVCDKYYLVQYCHDYYIENIKGYLWNYNSGNIVLVTNEGVYHIKREEILFMRPIKPFDIEGIEEKEQT